MTYKIVFCGNGGAGKTQLIKRYCLDEFDEKYEPTIAADFQTVKLEYEGKFINLNIFDLSGHTEFVEQRKELYKLATAVVIVFDITSQSSYESISL